MNKENELLYYLSVSPNKYGIYLFDIKNLTNFLIISDKNLKIRNQIFLDNLPIKINKLVEKINIEFMRQQFSNQSKVKINKYTIDLNSREMSRESAKLKLTEKQVNAIIYLSNLKQIGRWSAEMILLFTFNRSNIWPLQDIGLLRAISNNYNKKYFPPKIFLNKLYKKFTRYCSVATWYLWRSIDNEPIQY